MPISKTCYFCSRKGKKEQGCTLAWCDVCEDMHEFTPNADWLYIEKLEKENEELKKELQGLVDTLNTVKTR